jgi:hypothetical protein
MMLLRATDVLAQHSTGKDSSKNSAIFYAEAGLDLLKDCQGVYLPVTFEHTPMASSEALPRSGLCDALRCYAATLFHHLAGIVFHVA